MSLALSRTCDLRDFPGCLTVADWQQGLANLAWETWLHMHHLRTRTPSLVVNYAGVPFQAPGPTAIYRSSDIPSNGSGPVSAIFGLSVLDHVEAPVTFLSEAAEILQPPGLLVLTFAYWDAEGPDTAAGHDERRRIYSAASYQKLIREARRVGFENFGRIDWRYHGDFLEDHSLASLVLTKRGRP
jgi:SAM-dependent methyltransferase